MELKEAKEILNKNGFLVENSVTGLDDSDKLIYLYLSLKNEGYDVSDSTDLVVREKTFKLKIKQQIEIEKLGLTVNVSSIVISEDGCEITAILGGENHSFVTIPLDSAVFNLDKLNRLIPNNMRSFINVDIHNAIYSYLSKK
jgi:hypothetical protein